ncbi:MAG: hypothetical protein HZA17_06390 [Nitrospirae bacterium]|nr:hypothetical protein [Nitrospirota bacterium]
MTSRQAEENNDELLHIISKWKALEDKAIASAYDLLSRTSNPLVRMIMDLIMHDSEKHKLVQQMIIDTLTKEAIHVSPDELEALSEGLNSHVEAEEEAISLAQAALGKCKLVSTHFLLSFLIADEKKHHALMTGLNNLRMASIPTSAGVRLRETETP